MKYILFFILLVWSSFVFALEPATVQNSKQTVVEGVLSQVSKLPTPESNAYPDCYFTATIDINHILSGQSIPAKIVLVMPGFFSRQYSSQAKYKVGDKVRVTVVPFASMPDKVRQTQQADEIEDVNLDFYFSEEIALVQEFKNITNPVPFLGKKHKGEESTNFRPVDLKAKAARQEQMRHELENIDGLLAKHGGDWDKWYESLKDFRAQYKKQYDAKAQRWVENSFFSAGYLDSGKIYSPEFIKSIVAFKNYLAERNVDLILVRVPNKGEVVDDLFAPVPPDQISNPFLLRMYKDLLEADVEIITDIIPRAKKARLKYPLMYWFQDFAEPHPAEGIAWVVADALAERLNRYEKIRNFPKVNFRLLQVSTGTDISTDSHIFYWPRENPKFSPKEYVQFSAVSFNDGKILRPKQGSDSPILIVGSSFIEYPSLRLGGNIPSYLANLTGIIPDILYRSGSGLGIPRTIARENDTFLKKRSVCLFPLQPWVFFDALSSPPIIDVTKANKTLLTSHTGTDLQKQIRFVLEKSKDVFSYSSEGSLNVQASNKDTRIGGSFSFSLPDKISDFPFFMLEIESRIGDAAYIQARYNTQSDTIYKSYSQLNSNDTMIFKSENNHILDFEILNIHPTIPTVIKSIIVYGLQQNTVNKTK